MEPQCGSNLNSAMVVEDKIRMIWYEDQESVSDFQKPKFRDLHEPSEMINDYH